MPSRSKISARLTRKLEAFLTTKGESERGGWAKVAPNDVQQLLGIIRAILEAKYEPDADGDLPIECTLIDRTIYERMQFFPIRYDRDTDTDEEQERNLSLMSTNVVMAAKRMQLEMDMRRHRKEQSHAE